MNTLTDQELLRDYTERRSEESFAKLVRRHVDHVFSAALRMVHDAHLAEDVTQSVFLALAQNARQLADHPVLSGWLHRTALNLAVKTVRSDARRRTHEQEAAMNGLLATEPDAVREQIAPHLDAALGDLSRADDTTLQRYQFLLHPGTLHDNLSDIIVKVIASPVDAEGCDTTGRFQ